MSLYKRFYHKNIQDLRFSFFDYLDKEFGKIEINSHYLNVFLEECKCNFMGALSKDWLIKEWVSSADNYQTTYNEYGEPYTVYGPNIWKNKLTKDEVYYLLAGVIKINKQIKTNVSLIKLEINIDAVYELWKKEGYAK